MAKRDYSRVLDSVSTLGTTLLGKFEEAEKARQEVEQRWLDDLRQYRGDYTSEQLSAMDKNRSRTFLRVTRLKVEILTRLMLQVALGNSDKSWTIEPTPNPDVPQADWDGLVQRVLAQKPDAGPEDFETAARALVRIRAENMSKEIADQLDGNEDRRWSDMIRKAFTSANIYGTGCLKGPLVESYAGTVWKKRPGAPDPQTGQPTMTWQPVREDTLRPYVEHVPVWSLYPDHSAKSLKEATFVFERHIMSKLELRALGKREDFDESKIDEYVEAYPDGSADTWKSYESQLNSMSSDVSNPKRERQYEVLEFWGTVRKGDLNDCGCSTLEEDAEEESDDPLADINALPELSAFEMPEPGESAEEEEGEDADEDVWAHVWMLGPVIIKAAVQPLDNIKLPYFFCYFDKDETSIWGNGLPVITRDCQTMVNSAMRLILDNAAICAGPQIEVKTDRIDSGEDPTDIYPFKVWLSNSGMGGSDSPAVTFTGIPSMIADGLQVLEKAVIFFDEVSGVPRVDGGDEKVGQGAQTATGLSMLMQRSNAMVREMLLRFDDDVTRPLITAIYQWNMQFNPREDIKGDYQIKARGIAGIQAKEIRAQQVAQFWGMSAQDPELRSMIKIDELLKVISTNMEIPDTILRDKADFAQFQEQQQQQQAMMQGQAAIQQLTPVLKQHEQTMQQMQQAIQQISKAVQQMMGKDDGGAKQAELAIKAQATQGDHALRAEALNVEREKLQAKKLEIAGNLEAKKMSHEHGAMMDGMEMGQRMVEGQRQQAERPDGA